MVTRGSSLPQLTFAPPEGPLGVPVSVNLTHRLEVATASLSAF